MSDDHTGQGGALAGLRERIRALVEAERGYGRSLCSEPSWASEKLEVAKGQLADVLDAELVAVEASRARLARFARASDAFSPFDPLTTSYFSAKNELAAARQAITDEDLGR